MAGRWSHRRAADRPIARCSSRTGNCRRRAHFSGAVSDLARRTGAAPVAAGFAEFQPLDTATTEDAYKRNRRIELKLTNAEPRMAGAPSSAPAQTMKTPPSLWCETGSRPIQDISRACAMVARALAQRTGAGSFDHRRRAVGRVDRRYRPVAISINWWSTPGTRLRSRQFADRRGEAIVADGITRSRSTPTTPAPSGSTGATDLWMPADVNPTGAARTEDGVAAVTSALVVDHERGERPAAAVAGGIAGRTVGR